MDSFAFSLLFPQKNMQKIQLLDKEFEPFIAESEIQAAVSRVANQINVNFAGKSPLFLIVLNGAFMFAADMMKQLTITCELSFVKIASYHGAEQKDLQELIGLNEDLTGREVIIVEDIVDSGNTVHRIFEMLKEKNAAKVYVASMFFKPGAYKYQHPIQYTGLNIANDFIVGYGLDYNGVGRNLNAIYVYKP
jgi:hypoxanthine phosphoribosyltransferase